MEGLKKNYTYIGKGVLRACIFTVVIAFILALVQAFINLSESVLSVCILITTIFSIIYGCVYAARKINYKGWVVGILVSVLYMLILYIAALIGGKDGLIMKDLWRLLLAVLAGTLSGMLGINL